MPSTKEIKREEDNPLSYILRRDIKMAIEGIKRKG